jgi:DNA-binding response OmpR family regulator
VYNQMVGFNQRLLDEAANGVHVLGPDAQLALDRDIAILRDHLDRYERRLNFWYDAHLRLAGIVVDPETRTIDHRGVTVQLTGREYQLLDVLLTHAGHHLSARQLITEAWDNPSLSGDELRAYIAHLRKKMEHIKLGTIHNRPHSGYSLVFEEDLDIKES